MDLRTGSAALIEERVDTGLKELLDSYQPNFTLGGTQRDDIGGRFTINAHAAIPDLSTPYAQAFEAKDGNNPNRALYALAMKRNANYRLQTAEALIGSQHPHLVSVLAQGTVFLTPLNEAYYVAVLDRPSGPKLSEIIKQKRINQEHIIKEAIINPTHKALLALKEKQIVHGNINLDTLFIGDVLQLGECISAPPGCIQHYLFEPLERMMCDNYAKGSGNDKVDVYAIAVTAYSLIYGLEHLERKGKEQFISEALTLGTYNVFANNIDFPDGMQDFFKGILNDNPQERWGLEQLGQWLGGKRFNMISAYSTSDSVRPITFDGEEFYSQRALANSMHRKWRDAVKDARNLKLDRWAEMSLHKPEVAEYVLRAIRIAGPESAATERQNSEMLTRILCILDPIGPFRSRLVSMRLEGIGTAIAHYVETNQTSELQQLLDIIEADIPNFWAEMMETSKNPEFSQILWKLQRVRTHLKMRSLGFGLERILYDLNPNLPCQSPLLLPYHITTLQDALRTLDVLAKRLAPDTSIVDRHIAAFLASKIDMGKDIKIHELASIPQLVRNPELIMMKILAKAQVKHDKVLLPGLCTWAAMRMEGMLDTIHNRAYRRKLKLMLKPAAKAGYLNDVINILASKELTSSDLQGFTQAINIYQRNNERMNSMQNPRVVEKMATELGGRISALIAYSILSVVCYMKIAQYMGW